MSTNELNPTINRVIKRLDELPPLIAKAMEDTNHQENIKDMDNGLKDMLIGFSLLASAEKNEDKKAKYSNQSMREARAREMAKDDDDYQQLYAAWKKATETQKRAVSLLETLRLEFQAQKSALYAFTEMLKTENIKLSAAPKVVAVEVHHDAQ